RLLRPQVNSRLSAVLPPDLVVCAVPPAVPEVLRYPGRYHGIAAASCPGAPRGYESALCRRLLFDPGEWWAEYRKAGPAGKPHGFRVLFSRARPVPAD